MGSMYEPTNTNGSNDGIGAVLFRNSDIKIKRTRIKVRCPICRKVFNRSKHDFEECSLNNFDEIKKNCEIFNISNSTNRQDFAIWRLYRYCDLHPSYIAQILHVECGYVANTIGRIFKSLCVKDDRCVFKRFLENPYIPEGGK